MSKIWVRIIEEREVTRYTFGRNRIIKENILTWDRVRLVCKEYPDVDCLATVGEDLRDRRDDCYKDKKVVPTIMHTLLL